jgi:glycosyltransferase involved in cell wall biosynthesis
MQASFLSEAIDSALAQTYFNTEVIVVNDGSLDDTDRVAARYSDIAAVRYLWQPNAGLSAARNTGLRASEGVFIVFLDADDRLMPRALEAGVRAFQEHPESGFVWGRCHMITADGTFLPSKPKPRIMNDHYETLLRHNYIRTPGSVMYRRSVVKEMNGFNEQINGAQDYDLHLRIAKSWPVYCHDEPTLEYRVHAMSMSHNSATMLRGTLNALRRQQPHVRTHAELLPSYRVGVRSWQRQYGFLLIDSMIPRVRRGQLRSVMRDSAVLLRYYPQGPLTYAGRALIRMMERIPWLWRVARTVSRGVVGSVNRLRALAR